MYIIYNSNKYPCKCKPSKTMRYRELPEDFPFPVSGKIELYADDGFHLRTDVAADYLRQTFENGVLMLTNEPEPEPMEPMPEPEAELTQLDRIEAQVTYTAMMTDTLLEV